MVRSIREAASHAKTAVTAAMLATDVSVSKTPDMFKSHLSLLYPAAGESYEHFYKRLLKLVIFDDTVHMEALSVVAALLSCANTKFYTDFRQKLRESEVRVTELSIDDYVDMNPELEDAEINDISIFEKMEPSHFVYSLSLLLTIIGKKLNNSNFTAWSARRKKTFSAPLGLRESDHILDNLHPSLQFADDEYDQIKIYPEIRRLFFLNVMAFSNKSDLLGAGTKITMTLLRGAELSNWTFIRYWIIQLNPDLLMWNELAKYLPTLNAAFEKFNAMGRLADWCKLIFPSTELREFHFAES